MLSNHLAACSLNAGFLVPDQVTAERKSKRDEEIAS